MYKIKIVEEKKCKEFFIVFVYPCLLQNVCARVSAAVQRSVTSVSQMKNKKQKKKAK